VAFVPLKATDVTPVKLDPVITTLEPIPPASGDKPETTGATMTVKFVALVPEPPPVLTLIFPVVAPEGTVAVICVEELTV